MSSQPSLISVASDIQVVRPGTPFQWQMFRNTAGAGLGAYFAMNQNGIIEPISSGGSSGYTEDFTPGITAFAAGGQVGATVLPLIADGGAYYRIETVAANNASVKPGPEILKNMKWGILNRSGNGNSVMAYPPVGLRFFNTDGLMAIDAPIEVFDGTGLFASAFENGVLTIQ